ncbi:MAG: hypothetical protein DVS81_04635 [Candidatus Accumulibacter meliphilus]|jgi:hypothetical protein|uniref:PIN domain-containing protein n=1 Tax=Candidatus Accumulibacter meliphilus TaxID=2211374 RepID=A0A369XNG8_9PROT|nr:MAG: hypothetical protein DVS81_04635 [Candidatus Accumulibacter meliphilus]
MKGGRTSRLVIDASIARASGGIEAVHPTATAVRDFLQKVLIMCHRAVMTPAIRLEWEKHESAFARKWRRSMVARKKVIVIATQEMSEVRAAIKDGPASQNDKSAMIKDLLLVEAAIATDERVIALDDKVQTLFIVESKRIAALRRIVWINPVSNSAGAMALLNGEECERQWSLAAMSNEM